MRESYLWRVKIGVIALSITNLLLLAVLLAHWFAPAIRLFRQDATEADVLGMAIWVRKKPFTVYLDKGYPQQKSFLVKIDGMPLKLQCTDGATGGYAVSTILQNQEGVTIAFAATNKVEILSTMLSRREGCFIDIGANGDYDIVRR